eukprot:199068-Chlamydomonas_euryale.AAC.1
MNKFFRITPSKAPGGGSAGGQPAGGAATPGSTARAAGLSGDGGRGDGSPERGAGAVAAARATLDAALAKGLDDAAMPAHVAATAAGWKAVGQHACPQRLLGVPASWARKPGCSLDPSEHVSRCAPLWATGLPGRLHLECVPDTGDPSLPRSLLPVAHRRLLSPLPLVPSHPKAVFLHRVVALRASVARLSRAHQAVEPQPGSSSKLLFPTLV